MTTRDTARIDALEAATTLHQFPEISYLVDCYEIVIVRTDGRLDTRYVGETLREALDQLRGVTDE